MEKVPSSKEVIMQGTWHSSTVRYACVLREEYRKRCLAGVGFSKKQIYYIVEITVSISDATVWFVIV